MNVLEKIKLIPEKPGCYLWKDKNQNILYIGKSKNLLKRTKQYFDKSHNGRITKLVRNIADVDYIVVKNENEALILENNLINKHKPKYNILLKDSSNYPYIMVSNETHPRIKYTHRYIKNSGTYYGPFATKDNNIYEIYKFLERIIPFRKCNPIPKKTCIYYDMNRCLGPCINKIGKEDYDVLKNNIHDIFNKKAVNIINDLKKKELNASDNEDFLDAKKYLDLQIGLKSIIDNQNVQFNNQDDIDIISFLVDDDTISIYIFNFINGFLINKHNHISKIYSEINEALISYLMQYYSTNKVPKKIYINIDSDELDNLSEVLNTKIIAAKKGKYFDLINQGLINAKDDLKVNKTKYLIEYDKTIKAVDDLAQLINIDSANRIEAFDNSNLFLSTPVSAVVVCENGKFNKSKYRKFNLTSEENKSDYQYMYEVIKRRYSRQIKNNQLLPELIIVDGGKIQVSAANLALSELNLTSQIAVIGLKKNSKHKTHSIIDANFNEIELDNKTNVYWFLSNIQEEIHRFVINFFRTKRNKSLFVSLLDGVKGIGSVTKNKILTIYPNILEIDNVDVKILCQIMPEKIAIELKDKIKNYLKESN